jgi:hypothetical protein
MLRHPMKPRDIKSPVRNFRQRVKGDVTSTLRNHVGVWGIQRLPPLCEGVSR